MGNISARVLDIFFLFFFFFRERLTTQGVVSKLGEESGKCEDLLFQLLLYKNLLVCFISSSLGFSLK